jgi:hypothetical protein
MSHPACHPDQAQQKQSEEQRTPDKPDRALHQVGVGLVTQTREGTTLVCHTNYDLMRGLINYMVEECCAEGTCAPGILPKKAA